METSAIGDSCRHLSAWLKEKELKIILFLFSNFSYAYFEKLCQPNIIFILFCKTKCAHSKYLARISGFAHPNTSGRRNFDY